MTLGGTNKDVREMTRGMYALTARVAALEGNAKRAFKRLLAWSVVAAVVSSALIWFVAR